MPPDRLQHREKMIGIVGGVGPYAGLDLVRKIFDRTRATGDRDHLPVALLSLPGEIGDRTAFLLGQTQINPAYAISKIIRMLEDVGADVVGIPCNTAHAPRIFDVIREELERTGSRVTLVHMIDEVARYIRENHSGMTAVGVLSTTGTYRTGIYPEILAENGIRAVVPDEALQDVVHAAIYDETYGIKAQPNPVTETARSRLLKAIDCLREEGTEGVVLGCTELPLAIPDRAVGDTVIIDPTEILAGRLIREVDPDKLRP